MRHDNHGLRKLCECARRTWPKCDHPWHVNFAWRGEHHRYSLDRLLSPRRIRTKIEAQTEANRIRAEIQAGTFRRPGAPITPSSGAVLATMTLSELFDAYERGHVKIARPASAKRWRGQVNAIRRHEVVLPNGTARAFGEWVATDITTDAIKQFQELRRTAGVFAMNRDLGVLRAVFNWAVGDGGFLERTPFKRAGVNAIRRGSEPRRSRRLEHGEAERLLAGSGAHLRNLIEAALETGCRRGELLSLQWSQVRAGARPAIVLTAAKTKTKTLREVPISARLAAILDMRRTGPDGEPQNPDAFVFGDACGAPIKSVSRAWATAKLRANGVTPAYVKGTAALTPECLTKLAAIDLHFHDLRREAGSRWLDAGVPLHTIQRWLGHANISQTSTYLAVTDTGSHEAMARFDAARAVQPIATEAGNGHQTKVNGSGEANTDAQESQQITH